MNDKPKKANYGFLREAFGVRRFHTVSVMHDRETVGHHTCNVVAMIFFMYDDNPPLYMVRHALHHDAPELATGDIPAPVKWSNPPLNKMLEEIEKRQVEKFGLEAQALTSDEEAILRFADMMDLCFKTFEEMIGGNDYVAPIFQRGINFCHEIKTKYSLNTGMQELWNILKSNSHINIEEYVVEKEPRIISH